MAAQALTEALPALLEAVRARGRGGSPGRAPTEPAGVRILLLALGFLWFIQGAMFGFPLRNTSLRPPGPQQAMAWAAQNTPRESEFILLTGNGDAMTDPVQEWFPALAQRQSRTTLQGQEWMLGAGFFPRRDDLNTLQACGDTACLEDWSNRTATRYSHVLVQRNTKTERLLDSLSRDSRYTLLFESGDYLIFGR